jgi:ATP-binding cassette subfamily B protein
MKDDRTRAMSAQPRVPILSDSSLAMIRRLMSESGRQYVGRYVLAFIFMAITAASTALMAWIMRDVVDQIFVDRNATELVGISIAVLVVAIGRGVGAYGSTITLSRIGNSLVARIQKRLYDHLLALGVDFFDGMHSSEMVTRVSHNANAARNVLNILVTSFGRDLLSLIGLLIVMVVQSPTLSVMFLVLGPIIFISVSRISRRVREVARGEVNSIAAVTSVVQETSSGIRVVKAFGLEDFMKGRMDEAIQMVRRRANAITKFAARTGPLMETTGGIAYAALLLWAGYAAIYQGQKPGVFIAFMMALVLAYDPARRLALTRVQIETGLVGVGMMYELLDTKPSLNVNAGGPKLRFAGGEVVFDHVDFGYRGESQLFHGFDFTARAGATTALVGPSGSGKSTMIALIERFYDVGAGRITVDGQDIAKLDLASLRAHMALVSQDVVLFRGTIRENIRLGRLDATDAEVEQAARDAMAHDFIMATEKGYDTPLGDQGLQLSGGQRQRIAIARAMLRDAKIILLDEATSSLDSESEYHIQVAFDRLVRGRTTIVIAHRLSTVLHADKICVLVNGAIVEEGRHAELLALGRHYARLYHLQFEKPAERAAAPADAGENETAATGATAAAAE